MFRNSTYPTAIPRLERCLRVCPWDSRGYKQAPRSDLKPSVGLVSVCPQDLYLVPLGLGSRMGFSQGTRGPEVV